MTDFDVGVRAATGLHAIEEVADQRRGLINAGAAFDDFARDLHLPALIVDGQRSLTAAKSQISNLRFQIRRVAPWFDEIGRDDAHLLPIERQLPSTYAAIAPRSDSLVEQRQVGGQRQVG